MDSCQYPNVKSSPEYWSGYEDGYTSMYVEMQRLKEEKESYQSQYEYMMSVFESYIEKAKVQLRIVNGEVQTLIFLNK